MIIDYSDWRPANREALANVNGVLRYISHDERKSATAAELAELHSWSIGTGLVFEDAANRPTEGAKAGMADGEFARQVLEQLGVPHGRPLYIACDFDIEDYAPASSNPREKLGPVGDYLEQFRYALNAFGYISGIYGGYWAVSRAISADLCPWGWQTIAWSPVDQGIPQQDPRAALYQTGVQLFGNNADLNLAGWRDWGQFRKQTAWLTGASA